jgi:hypothetical protein
MFRGSASVPLALAGILPASQTVTEGQTRLPRQTVAIQTHICDQPSMVIIQFPDPAMERRAIAYLLGRFPGKTWANGETMVPEESLPHLATQEIEFSVKGRPSYDRAYPPVPNSSSAAL